MDGTPVSSQSVSLCPPTALTTADRSRGSLTRYTVFSKSVRSRFEIAYLLVARGLFVLCSSGPRSKRGASASAKRLAKGK